MINTNDNNNNIVSTPYDDVFRTMMNDCTELLIPVINEIFGKHYTGREKIIRQPDEHFLNRQEGNEQKRITDSAFTIITEDNKEEKYILECQSRADDTMLIRIFEYITQEALDSGELVNNTLTVTIANAAVLFLRSNRKTPESMYIIINTPGGSVKFAVPVMKIQSYSLAQMFDKELYFLLPFYIFNREKSFSRCEKDSAELDKLRCEYIDFVTRLEDLMNDEKISAYCRLAILDMSKKVLEHIARKYDNIKKGVRGIMGGKILEYEAKTIFRNGFTEGEQRGITIGEQRGISIGEQRGEQQGRSKALKAAIEFMKSQGLTSKQIDSFMDSMRDQD